MTAASVVLVFPSNAGTMIATKTLRDCGVVAKMMPTPRTVQSAANLCLSIEETLESKALAALKAANIAISAVFR
ncbi:MAG TPA: putative Se/S carrier-like protein [Candidatus Elarobacter sp.]|nr:putative Se/S carrier-like protein [Candidatus Elarobacter sp.]